MKVKGRSIGINVILQQVLAMANRLTTKNTLAQHALRYLL